MVFQMGQNMKFSEAMLKGYEKVGGKQCLGAYNKFEKGKAVAHCPIGAAIAGGMSEIGAINANWTFILDWRSSVVTLNDDETLPWEHIYGMAVAAGL